MEMYSPDKQGEYVPEAGVSNFSVQWLSDTLMTLETEVTEVQLPSVEFALQLEVMMANHQGHPHPPMFTWNAGMVMHMLKSDPMLRDLEHSRWMDQEQPTYSSLTNKADEDSPMRLHRPCRHTSEKHLQSGFPALLTLP